MTMSNVTRLLKCLQFRSLCILLLVVVTGGCGSSPESDLRQLRYHGHETKSTKDQQAFADRLVSHGAAAVPVLVEEIAELRYDGRYTPSPYDILSRIGKPGEQFVATEFNQLKGSDSAADQLRRFALETILVVSYGDEGAIGPWIDDCQAVWRKDQGVTIRAMIDRVVRYVEMHYESEAPTPMAEEECETAPLSPEFVKWWKAHARSGQ